MCSKRAVTRSTRGVAAGIALGVLHSDLVQFAGVAPIMIYLAEEDRVTTVSGLGLVAARGLAGTLRLRIRRPDPGRRPAHRRPGRARRLDRRARAARHDDVRRCRFGRVPLRERRVFCSPADGREPRRPCQRIPPLGIEPGRFSSPGGKPPVVGERFVQADLAGAIRHMMDEEAAARGGREAGPRRRARRLLSRRSRPRHGPLP